MDNLERSQHKPSPVEAARAAHLADLQHPKGEGLSPVEAAQVAHEGGVEYEADLASLREEYLKKLDRATVVDIFDKTRRASAGESREKILERTREGLEAMVNRKN